MKARNWCELGLAATVAILAYPARADDEIALRFKPQGTQGELRLHSRLGLPVSAMYPEYTIQCSTNLQDWFPVAGPFNGGVGVSDEELRVAVPLQGDRAIYRVVANVKLAEDGGGGEAVYGYGTEFSKELQRLGQLPLSDFVRLYSLTNQYLPQITFDPTTAEYWDLFSVDPAAWNATNSWTKRYVDYRLNPQELAVFQTNGFLVSQRLERPSFADVYYDIYTSDLPVFVTADSILQAWHRTFVTILAEIEETYFFPNLKMMLDGLAGRVPALWEEASGMWGGEAAGPVLTNGIADADYFLAVARSLANGTTYYGSFGQTNRVLATLSAISDQVPAVINLYGEPRAMDFSQFQVRGHYADSVVLSRYFRTMMWCALADFRFAGSSSGLGSGSSSNSVRELAGTVAFGFLSWGADFNRALEMYLGSPDSLHLGQVDGILRAAGITPSLLGPFPTDAALTNLQNRLMSGKVGMQQIGSGYYWSPFSAQQVKLPRSFAVMGQRFVIDSWALGKCTFDDIIWDEDGIPDVWDKVLRRVPSALDVAFSILGNNVIVPDIAARISRSGLTPVDGRVYWRDGLPYQHNLAAVRNVMDRQGAAGWTNSIYSHWLGCLRELSAPTTDPKYPECMRTRAWAMKDLNIQLASWTQLRHDTVLYAKQSYTPPHICSYPDGYVEPRPAFWGRMHEMAKATRAVLETVRGWGTFHYTNSSGGCTMSEQFMYSNRLAVMDQFVQTTATLRSISEKELAQLPLSTNETRFLQDIVETGSCPARTYSGWYPALFYRPGSLGEGVDRFPLLGDDQGSDYWDPLVTDVHTDLPDPIVGDPGSILHEGVGNVQLLMIAVDTGAGDRAVYAGPVLSHYEFELGPDTRMTDSEWRTKVTARDLPPQPDWTRCYLVPSP